MFLPDNEEDALKELIRAAKSAAWWIDSCLADANRPNKVLRDLQAAIERLEVIRCDTK